MDRKDHQIDDSAALYYHRNPRPGKLAVVATKPLSSQVDLSLAYSPGVAAACRVIVDDPAEAATVTARANLVAVITNGTAVLGLGDIGPLAAKPVMEGKAVLFKKFAGIDVFDIEVAENDPARLIEVVAALEPTFGAINLEDIKAPDCFVVESALRQRMKIPVFHDDQHGTAIIVAAGIRNALDIVDKPMDRAKVVCSGAGAAAIACLDLLVGLGMKTDNIIVTDIDGVVYPGRPAGRAGELHEKVRIYETDTEQRTLDDVIAGADIFLGLSAAGVLKPSMVEKMAARPIIFALANPVPEISPELVQQVRDDAIVATGRSDYPNQVNNVLCFPFIFRGALDAGATTINEEMKLACVEALAALARVEIPDTVVSAYGGGHMTFGPDYLIPKPFDPRLITSLAPATAKAAMDSGVATRPIADLDAYEEQLSGFVFRSGTLMKPVFDAAAEDPQRVVFAEGEEERVLRAIQFALDERLAKPILIGRRDVVESRIERFGLRYKLDRDVQLVDPTHDPQFRDYWTTYHELTERMGVTPDEAQRLVRSRNTVIGSLMVRKDDADALICGVYGRFDRHLKDILDIGGFEEGVKTAAALEALIISAGTFFICDPWVNAEPDADQLVEMTLLAANHVRRFGIEPRIAFLSASSFGDGTAACNLKMAAAVSELRYAAPELEVEGEMHADAAISPAVRARVFPNSRLTGAANLLIMPGADAANIALTFMKEAGDGISVGPMLLGAAQAAHVLTPSVTVRGIVNMTALAVVDAQKRRAEAAPGLQEATAR